MRTNRKLWIIAAIFVVLYLIQPPVTEYIVNMRTKVMESIKLGNQKMDTECVYDKCEGKTLTSGVINAPRHK